MLGVKFALLACIKSVEGFSELLWQVRLEYHSEDLLNTKANKAASKLPLVIQIEKEQPRQIEAEAPMKRENVDAMIFLLLFLCSPIQLHEGMNESLQNRLILLKIIVFDLFEVHIQDLDQKELNVDQLLARLPVLHVQHHALPRRLRFTKVDLL